jgi:tyrosine-protein phosphatase YwqE
MLKKIFRKFIDTKEEIFLLHQVDLHSHLIPSIDDGVKDLDNSISIIKQFKELGFKKIITTPHIMSSRFPNFRTNIYQGYNLLKEELTKQNIDIKLEVAAEYYYDEYFLSLIDKKDILTFGDNYVLFEFSYHYKPFELEQTIFKLISAGYKPILAHPERYSYYNTKEHYEKLKDLGLLFQINLISTQGFYGKNVKKSVEKIIDLGLVDFIGSDIHNQNYMDIFTKAVKSKKYLAVIEKNIIQNNYL